MKKILTSLPFPVFRWWCVAGLVCGLIPVEASSAALLVLVGAIELEPDTPDQVRNLEVVNTSAAAVATGGIQLNIQLSGGFEQVFAPVITDVDILSDTIFEDDNNGIAGGMDTNRRFELGTLQRIGDPVPMILPGSSRLASVVFDTTGYFVGSWQFSLSTPSGATGYFDLEAGVLLEVALEDGVVSIQEQSPAPRLPDPAPRLVRAGEGLQMEMTVIEESAVYASDDLALNSWARLESSAFVRIDPETIRIAANGPIRFFQVVRESSLEL